MREVKRQNIINSFIGCLLILFSGNVYSQYTPEPKIVTDSTKLQILYDYNRSLKPSSITDLSVNRKNMAIFCKWELDIEDRSKVPIKFRLGSQSVVDRLEQKGPTTTKID